MRAVGVRHEDLVVALGIGKGHPVAVERELATVRPPARSEVVGLGVARQGDQPGSVRIHRPDVEVRAAAIADKRDRPVATGESTERRGLRDSEACDADDCQGAPEALHAHHSLDG
jgi:hypothetical protein